MRFATISAAMLGLAAFASALPNPAERRMSWTPRSLERRHGDDRKDKNNNNDITIIDTTVIKLTEIERNSEVELTIKVEEKIKIEDQKKRAKDNVRKNHYRNKNKDVNTVIIVITEIVDIRDSKNQNKRYMRHQLRADNKARDDITIQITEVEVITISNSDSRHKDSKTKNHKDSIASDATGTAGAAIQTVDPNAPYQNNNQTVILPSGASAPRGKSEDSDPAAIVEELAEDLIVEVLGGGSHR